MQQPPTTTKQSTTHLHRLYKGLLLMYVTLFVFTISAFMDPETDSELLSLLVLISTLSASTLDIFTYIYKFHRHTN